MRKAYQGLVIGVDAAYVVHSQERTYARYGPGIGAIIGCQHFLRDRVSLSVEASPIYMQDTNTKSTQRNSARRYWYAFARIKIGIKL